VTDAALVLAAGRGSRMRSSLPKVLHQLAGRPMLTRVLDSLAAAGFPCPTVVVGYGADRIEAEIGDRCRYVTQTEQRGTGDAARTGMDVLPDAERVLVVHGDEPLIPPATYRRMLDLQSETGAPIVLLTAHVSDTRDFGRVIRRNGKPVALLQEGDLDAGERQIDEVNLGAYVFDAAFLRERLVALQPHPPKNELYLTDLIALATADGLAVAAVTVDNGDEIMGVNDLAQLERAGAAVYRAANRRLMESGVTIVDSVSTFIDDEAQIESDTIIHPFTIVRGTTRIGAGCEIGPGARIVDSAIGNRCRVQDSTIEASSVGDDVRIGPYAHLRPGTTIGARVEIGNYAEIKRSIVGAGSKLHHFSYIGDALVGTNVNIGAGTITCNFDGHTKHPTVIGDRAFIGSDTMLRAPVTIGEGAVTGAGSVVTRDVPANEVWAGVPARPLRDPDENREVGT